MLELKSVTETARLIDPAGQEAVQRIEHRTDPLTSTVASINTALGEKVKAFLGAADVQAIRDLQESSRASCPFCAASEKGTRFPGAFAAEGQIRIGNTIAMPNLFSKCALDSVVIVDHAQHVLFPSLISPEGLAHAVQAAAELVRRARTHDSSLVHHVAGMNFLQPGGSSVPHPHFQVHVRSVPYSGVARLERLCADFQARTGRAYWDALVEMERDLGERWLGDTGSVAWLAAWAPGHQKEIWGVLPGKRSLAEISDQDAAGFAAGISKVISFYEECGTHPFTLAFLSSPEAGGGSQALHVKLCSRPAFRPLYANYDTWFTPKLVGDDVHLEAPEQYAQRLRARW